jgi:hypothetical protein
MRHGKKLYCGAINYLTKILFSPYIPVSSNDASQYFSKESTMPPAVKRVVTSRSFSIYAYTALSALAYGFAAFPALVGS